MIFPFAIEVLKEEETTKARSAFAICSQKCFVRKAKVKPCQINACKGKIVIAHQRQRFAPKVLIFNNLGLYGAAYRAPGPDNETIDVYMATKGRTSKTHLADQGQPG